MSMSSDSRSNGREYRRRGDGEHDSRMKRRSFSSASESDSSSSSDERHRCSSRKKRRKDSRKKKTKKNKKYHSSSSEGESSSHERSRSGSSHRKKSKDKRDNAKKKQKKRKKEKKKEAKKQESNTKYKVDKQTSVCAGPVFTNVPDESLEVGPPKRRAMIPMTKEEYEKQQSKIRRVFDPETGRNRLIKGDGEVLEEIVSMERHKAINKAATQGDGVFFESALGLSKM